MPAKKNTEPKARLHPRNKNRERYDLKKLTSALPELKAYLVPNKSGEDSIDFSNPKAVKLLNRALLHSYYGLENWDFPDENLCPPIPGRADYLHRIADILAENNFGTIPKGSKVSCLDIGTGASCIYPIIGVAEYGWNFIASDIDPKSIESATKIVNSNPTLDGKIICKLQDDSMKIFQGIISNEDKIDFTICNPPFHASIEEAEKVSIRKVKNLTGKKSANAERNFAGVSNELVCEGGENGFIRKMIEESIQFSDNCLWFSTIVSKQSNLKGIFKVLEKAKAKQIKKIPLGTGNKSSRIVAWTFLSKEEHNSWREAKWGNSTK